jgi:uncharacterized membrane protein
VKRTTGVWTDARFDIVLAHVLRAGVLLSAAMVACGGIVFLRVHGLERPAYDVFRGEPGALRSVRGIVTDAVHGRGRGLTQCGLLLLIATPIARVVCSVFGFIKQRDWVYTGIMLGVLALLAYSLLAG